VVFLGLMIATGTMNLQGNLFDYEIVEQLYHANQQEKIRNVVFMGMGEPLGKLIVIFYFSHTYI
jgi:adenine C2-methylase RlmN of 23S rRNA A2503 and tRNA A37